MNARVMNNINIDQCIVYGTIFNTINDIISKLSTDPSEKTYEQLSQLTNILNGAYAKLPKTSKIKMAATNPLDGDSVLQVNNSYDHIQSRFMQLFMNMSVLSNHDALSNLKISTMHQNLLSDLSSKYQIALDKINAMESLKDIMDLNITSNIPLTINTIQSSSANGDVVAFHHNLKQRKFDQALNILQRCNALLNKGAFLLEPALRMVTLPSDSKVWRTSREFNKNKLNLHPLKLEIPAIINLCIRSIPKLPIDQNSMAQCLEPIPNVMEHITKEHGSMKLAHQIMKNILETRELPLTVSTVRKYLDLYTEYDEFLSSPIPILESILKRYIPPSIISSNIGHQHHKTKGIIDNAYMDFASMTKTDGFDDKLDPFNSFHGEAGYKILPKDVYAKMLKVLNQYSSVHGLGHFNMDQASHPITEQKQQKQNPSKLDSMGRKNVIESCNFIWKIMEWDGHNADINIYNTMLDTLCKWDEITPALSLFEEMVGDSKFNSNRDGFIQPNNQTLYILADAMVHPISITHFVQDISPKEWENTLSNKLRHLQHKSWFNIYKHRGQILNELSTKDRCSWINLQKKHGDIIHNSTNELFFGYFPRTQFLMAQALNRLEEVSAVLNDNASEWLDNLIECYVIQYLPDYKHVFKVKPQTLRMDIIRQICESKS